MDEIWEIEEKFWLKGVDTFESHLDQKCLMALPEPVGILAREEVLNSLKGIPRWSHVHFDSKHISQPSLNLVVAAYRVDGKRGNSSYSAYCTSTYLKREGKWLLVQHQQTPLD